MGLVLGAVVLLLLFQVLDLSPSKKKDTSASDADLMEMRARVAALKEKANDDYVEGPQYGGGSTSFGIDPVKLADQISRESNTLSGIIGDFNSEIVKRDALLETARSNEVALNSRIQELLQRIGDLNEDASQAVTLRKQLESLQTLYDAAQRQIVELSKRPDAGTLERLRAENNRLSQQIATVGALEAQNADLLEQLRNLRAQLARSTLFVDSVDNLPAIAQRLFRELQRLDNTEPAAIPSEYGRIKGKLNARPLRSILFAEGSSQLSPEKISMIRNDLQDSHPSAFLLVVGYASKVGDSASNRSLSSDRATAVASQVNQAIKGQQDVRAVFLSETSRFSKSDPTQNQLCEIWEIQP